MIDEASLTAMAGRLVRVPGVVAVSLGGSRARGDHTPDSDVDLGLYYAGPLDRAGLREYAVELGQDPDVVTRPGAWGPWVDGGAWLRIDGTAVDWIYRDVDRVDRSVADARAGRTTREAQVGHPVGFPAFGYAAEVAVGRPLADPDGILAAWRARLTPYPAALTAALVADLWVADFHLAVARKAVTRADSVYAASCVSDALLRAALALHGRAGRWPTNEKGLVPAAGRLPGAPPDFADRCAAAVAALRPGRLAEGIDLAAALVAEVAAQGER